MAEYKTTTKKITRDYIYAVGRRREAVARVRIYQGKTATAFGNEYKSGDIIVNGKPVGEYFRIKTFIPVYKKIFEVTDTLGKFVVTAKVEGGGLAGQLDAMLHGVARALDRIDTDKYHSVLKENGYLTRDARTRERRKVGTGGKARRQKQSPKR